VLLVGQAQMLHTFLYCHLDDILSRLRDSTIGLYFQLAPSNTRLTDCDTLQASNGSRGSDSWSEPILVQFPGKLPSRLMQQASF